MIDAEVTAFVTVWYGCDIAVRCKLRGERHVLPGVYHVSDTAGQEWIVRVVERAQQPSLEHTARLLQWLEQRQYPAPRPQLPVRRQQEADYAIQILTYVPGVPIDRSPKALGLLASTRARLHSLPTDNFPPVDSWWSPSTVFADTANRLQEGRRRVPVRYHALIDQLLATVSQLAQLEANSVIHGDCWYANAIRVGSDAVVLIDWDCAGWGPSVLDLGALLLTSHYDLANPFDVTVTPERIHAIMIGYQAVRPLPLDERGYLAASISFYLAFNAGRLLTSLASVDEAMEFQLEKLTARLAATSAISELARQSIC